MLINFHEKQFNRISMKFANDDADIIIKIRFGTRIDLYKSHVLTLNCG